MNASLGRSCFVAAQKYPLANDALPASSGGPDLDLAEQSVGDGCVVQPSECVLEGCEASEVAPDASRRMQRLEELGRIARLLGCNAHLMALFGRALRQAFAALEQLLVAADQDPCRTLLQ
ncbi:MAG: hypothetical protein Q8K96_18295 [Rubrivivax sp.]|nr:hypothetical protein [Rubrivivax sp.]